MTATWLEEVQQRISHLRERVTKAPEASKADLEMMVDRIATSFKNLAVMAEEASKETKAGDAQHVLGILHGLRVQGDQTLGALKAELRFIEKNLESIKPDEPRSEFGRPISVPHTLRSRPGGATEERPSMRRLKEMDERAAPGKFKVGDKVNVLTDAGWEDGTIRKAEGGDFLVVFPDGESDWHPAEDLYPPGKFKREDRISERAAAPSRTGAHPAYDLGRDTADAHSDDWTGSFSQGDLRRTAEEQADEEIQSGNLTQADKKKFVAGYIDGINTAVGGKTESHSGRRLAGMREAVAAGFTAVSLYIDDERVQIGDPDYVKMTDDVEGLVGDLKQKYRGAKVTVTPSGEREVMIEVERKGRGESLGERAAPTGEDLTHDIWREIGRWLEDEEELELHDINEPISSASKTELKTLKQNVEYIVLRELEKTVGKLPQKAVTVEVDGASLRSQKETDAQPYRAVGGFRIWHDQDSAAQGSFTAEGSAGDLQNMMVNITQASGHRKNNAVLQFFG